MTPQEIKQILIEICKTSSKAKEILKRVNGKNDYKEIAKLLNIHPTLCSSILSKAKTFGLLTKTGNTYKKTPEFKHINIESALKSAPLSLPEEKKLTVKKRKKVVITSDIKKKIVDYFQDHFKIIPHPFSPSTKTKIDDADLRKASEKLFEYIEKDIGLTQLDGLSLRFFESFAAWFSVDRIKKAELINSFSSMVKCFEPYVKKVAATKTSNFNNAKPGLSKEMIAKVVSFSSDIDKKQTDYWKDKPIHEASLRVIYPYRHIEAHEARDYTGFDMEKVIYYMFVSIICINLNY